MRSFVKVLTFSMLVLWSIDSNSQRVKSKPNVVIILADDMGMGDAQCYGATDVRTPNIDAIANQGVRFTEAYVTASVCGPSRAGLMTGVYQ